MDKLTATLLADGGGVMLVRIVCSVRLRQGREYYHINYGLLGEFFGVPQSGSRRPSAIS
jgi:hypothetical protein